MGRFVGAASHHSAADIGRTRDAATESLAPLIKWVLPAGIAVLTIALIGGYEFHWTWTGVTPRDQLWGDTLDSSACEINSTRIWRATNAHQHRE